MQWCGFGIAAAVARDHVQLRDRHIERAFIRIFEMKEFHLAFTHIKINQTVIAPNPVLSVHNGIALAQLRKIPHHRLHVAGALLVAFAPSCGGAVSRVEIALGQKDQGLACERKASREWRNRNAKVQVLCQKFCNRFGLRIRCNAVLAKHLHNRFTSSVRIGTQDDARMCRGRLMRIVIEQGSQLGEWILGSARYADGGCGRKVRVRFARC